MLMPAQQFPHNPLDSFTFPSGAIGFRNKLVGPYAKVINCPIYGATSRLTCYATGVSNDSKFINACTTKDKKYVGGYITEAGIFHPQPPMQISYTTQQLPSGNWTIKGFPSFKSNSEFGVIQLFEEAYPGTKVTAS